jgi:SAM-dependent methyltransferase
MAQSSTLRPLQRRKLPPIFVAVLAQLIATCLLWLTLSAKTAHAWQLLSPLRLAILQGSVAALISYVLGQRAWWLAIHVVFWPTVIAARTLHLSASIYFGAFLFVLLFYWNTYRTQVPLFLSGRKIWDSLATLLPKEKPFRLIDIGCGFGGVLAYLSRSHPHGSYFGVELAPMPWLIAWLRNLFSGRRYRVARRDYRRVDLRHFDIVFCFLSPAAMPQLWQQARQQMRKGSLLVSCEFAVPGEKPSFEIETGGSRGQLLYVWRIP